MKAYLATGSLLLIVVLLVSFALPAGVARALNAPVVCAIQTVNGHYLTAVGGGGRITDVIHTDATRVGSWEKFTLVDQGAGSPIQYGIQTVNGHYLTAVGGGGRITDVIHSDATQVRGWEIFYLDSLGDGQYAIKTSKGNYLTAVGGGGRTTDTIHSDATRIGSWEKFKVICPIR
jgi:hypothetical protein